MEGTTARQKLKTPVKLMAMLRCQSSSVCSQRGAAGPAIPALLTSTSICPVFRKTCSTAERTEPASATSASTAKAPWGSADATCLACSRFRSTTATVAPAAARRVAMALPMPVAAPVTMAVWPSRLNMTGTVGVATGGL